MTGLDTHPAAGTIDFGHLFLTSSMDWTVKLWSLKENRPLYSFEDNGDYVYDVAWVPNRVRWAVLLGPLDADGAVDRSDEKKMVLVIDAFLHQLIAASAELNPGVLLRKAADQRLRAIV